MCRISMVLTLHNLRQAPKPKLTPTSARAIILDMNNRLFMAVAGATVILFILPLTVNIRFLWGMNHLHYLPTAVAAPLALLLCLGAGAAFAFGADRTRAPGEKSRVAQLVSESPWPAVVVALLMTGLFWMLRAPVHFLGDGYTNIAVFGQGEGSLCKWTSYGSMLIVRMVQRLLGPLNETSARQAFQLVSVLSGGATVFVLLRIARQIGTDIGTRLLASLVLLFSGVLLLFFGYAEFYPPLWAFGALFFLVALKTVNDSRSIWWVWVSLALTVAMHLQALMLVPAALWLTVAPREKRTGRPLFTRNHLITGAVVAVAAIVGFVWLYNRHLAFEVMFLPLFEGRPQSPAYAVFSVKHLIDILNLVLVVCPAVLLLTGLRLAARRRSAPPDGVATFLLLASAGTVPFLLLVDPVFGMGRDWDLVAFTLLPVLLWLVRSISVRAKTVSSRVLMVTAVVAVVGSGSYVAVNSHPPSAAQRFESLLEFYDRKDRSGWSILADYYRESGQSRRASEAIAQMKRRFPEYDYLEEAYRLVNANRYQEALPIAGRLVAKNPYNADFLQLLGNIQGKLGDFGDAERLYEDAVALKPYNVGIRNELGQLYITYGRYDKGLAVLKRLRDFNPQLTHVAEGVALAYIRKGEYHSALALADSILAVSPHAPGAYLIRIAVAVNRGDTATARTNLRLFVEYGKGRSDYEAMLRYYGALLD
ncbi:tetratricopeptide repeat protein [candidate division GN15 bacterium]|nr:tetratricopeptide repeat protein [candidate division GN15 bacterium]